jgi:hypothetical protein
MTGMERWRRGSYGPYGIRLSSGQENGWRGAENRTTAIGVSVARTSGPATLAVGETYGERTSQVESLVRCACRSCGPAARAQPDSDRPDRHGCENLASAKRDHTARTTVKQVQVDESASAHRAGISHARINACKPLRCRSISSGVGPAGDFILGTHERFLSSIESLECRTMIASFAGLSINSVRIVG